MYCQLCRWMEVLKKAVVGDMEGSYSPSCSSLTLIPQSPTILDSHQAPLMHLTPHKEPDINIRGEDEDDNRKHKDDVSSSNETDSS